MSKNQGVLITGVASGSPVEKAELQPGDVITAIDDKEQKEDTAMMDYFNSLGLDKVLISFITTVIPKTKYQLHGYRSRHPSFV